MRRFKQIFLFIALLIVALFVLVFILENKAKVAVSFMSYMTPELPLSVLIIVAFLFGLILALTVSYFVLLKMRLKLSMVKKQLVTYKKELASNNTTALQVK